MALETEVGLGPVHILLDGDPATPPQNRGQSPQFSANVYCGQTAEWIKMPLSIYVGLCPGDTLLDGAQFCTKGGTTHHFSAYVYWAKRLYASGYHSVWR